MSATGAGQTDIGGVQPEPVHQVKEFDLLLDGWFTNRRRLQTIAQSLVVKPDVTIGCLQRRLDRVPIVNEFFVRHRDTLRTATIMN